MCYCVVYRPISASMGGFVGCEQLPESAPVTGSGGNEAWGDDFLPAGMTAASVRPLTGGEVNSTWLVILTDGRPVVVKGGRVAPSGLFAAEAAGLAVLADCGRLRTPQVLATGPTFLMLEAMNPRIPASPGFWEAAALAVARLHSKVSPRHGWDHDGWLGWLPQENAWDEDGHRFFAEHRILRYLREPAAQQALDARDRAGLERLCARLPALIPASPAVLTHGDLWRGNMADATGGPAFIDPAGPRHHQTIFLNARHPALGPGRVGWGRRAAPSTVASGVAHRPCGGALRARAIAPPGCGT
jgi:fructosamine-3-kinase